MQYIVLRTSGIPVYIVPVDTTRETLISILYLASILYKLYVLEETEHWVQYNPATMVVHGAKVHNEILDSFSLYGPV